MAVESTDILVLQKGIAGELRKATVADLLNINGGGSNYLPISGGDLTGDLTLGIDKITLNSTDGSADFESDVTANAFIGDGSQLTNLPDQVTGVYLPLTGGSLTGDLTAIKFIGDGSQLTNLPDQVTNVYLPLTGGTLTGDLTAPKFIGDGSLLTNLPGGGGGASVSVDDAPPADVEEGDLWWNTTDNTLYIYYIDDTSEQWVAATPTESGSIDEDDFVAVDGDNMTGNLTLGTDKITLDAADGTITSARRFRTGTNGSSPGTYGSFLGVSGGNTAQLELYSNTTSGAAIAIKSAPDASTTKTPRVTINHDGSAAFDGTITAASSIINDVTVGNNLRVNNNLAVYAAAGSIYEGYDTSSGSSVNTFKVTAAGSATFAGTVTAGGYSLSQLPQL